MWSELVTQGSHRSPLTLLHKDFAVAETAIAEIRNTQKALEVGIK